uniref:Uncharacterized protein n=1 Tax=Tetranychus urticae TaxID=32264 RepID=T1KUZ1_TETUR
MLCKCNSNNNDNCNNNHNNKYVAVIKGVKAKCYIDMKKRMKRKKINKRNKLDADEDDADDGDDGDDEGEQKERKRCVDVLKGRDKAKWPGKGIFWFLVHLSPPQ